jgi:hypothetical protein
MVFNIFSYITMAKGLSHNLKEVIAGTMQTPYIKQEDKISVSLIQLDKIRFNILGTLEKLGIHVTAYSKD